MTPKEKAEELYNMYNRFGKLNDSEVKECAFDMVDKMLNNAGFISPHSRDSYREYWGNVKEEIENL